MFAKQPFPENTSPLCKEYLKDLVNAVESLNLFEQQKASGFVEMLCNRRCLVSLEWFYRNYTNHPSIFVKQIAQKAYDNLKHLS
jgi:hypothetical protein